MSRKATEPAGNPDDMPVLPLRDVVVFPHMVIPLFVGRETSIKALELGTDNEKQIFLAAQKDASEDEPKLKDIYKVGTVANILQMLKLPDGTVKRATVLKYVQSESCYLAEIEVVDEASMDPQEAEVLSRSLLSVFEQYMKLNKKIPPEVLSALSGIENVGRLADSIAAHMTLKVDDKQKILELTDIHKRVEACIVFMEAEIDLLEVENRIRGRVKKQMEKSQREYYLNEQIKAIQKELGDLEHPGGDLEEYAVNIEKAGMSKEAKEKALTELAKLKAMPPMSAEATVCRNYLDALLGKI